jgi:hypothetical protein
MSASPLLPMPVAGASAHPRAADPVRLRRAAEGPEAWSYSWIDPWHTDRTGIEAFISGVFDERYGATLSVFHDQLIGCRDAQGQWVAAVGFSALAHRAAFLEQYLDRPVEQAIEGARTRDPGQGRVCRWNVAEVGNLASTRPGASRALILKMTQYLHRRHFRWVVFTATQCLANSFTKLHYQPAVLAAADSGKLSGNPQDWGDYYRNNPRVMVGNVHTAYERFFAAH